MLVPVDLLLKPVMKRVLNFMPRGVHDGFLRKEDRYNWKGENASYNAFHKWLYNNFGNANKCENLNCKCLSPKRYEWSLIKGKQYAHKRENFWMLCKSCHIKYDMNPKWKLKLQQLRLGTRLSEQHRLKIGLKHLGMKYERHIPVKYCNFSNCESVYFAKGFCSKHYQRIY
jgi:hypothetical protein